MKPIQIEMRGIVRLCTYENVRLKEDLKTMTGATFTNNLHLFPDISYGKNFASVHYIDQFWNELNVG